MQNGNDIIGTYGAEGQLWGTITGDKIKFQYNAGSSGYGDGVWTIRGTETKLYGNWFDYTESGQWIMTRLKKSEEISATPEISVSTKSYSQSDTYNLSGKYIASITGNKFYLDVRSKTTDVTLSHRGNRISGIFNNNKGSLEGEVRGDKIEFNWLTGRGEGKGIWSIEKDGIRLSGSWQGSFSEGKWNMERTE